MFQYALGRKISYINNVELKLDISGFRTYKLRLYNINKYNIVEKIATDEEIEPFLQSNIELNRRELKKLHNLSGLFSPYYKRRYVRERSNLFDPNILKITDNAYLDGYWASYKYFADIEDLLQNDFTVKDDMDRMNADIAHAISETESVSIHFRRGDYVTNPHTNAYHGTCSLDYYQKAVKDICKQVPDPRFFVFSDDPEWVQQNFSIPYPIKFVTINGPDEPYKDLQLMSLCKHHITANSSFSWWGAYLCTNKDKRVYSPNKWFNVDYNLRDVIPESWKRF
jgi:hypothetical protein